MRLSDRDILLALEQGRIRFSNNPQLDDISGCTVDLHLGYGFRIPVSHPQGMIDLSSASASEQIEKAMSEVYTILPPKSFWIHPGELVLGATLEAVTLPDDLVGWLDGRSSLARLGLMVHMTAHRIDPGWSGEIVLEFFNAGKYPIGLYPTMPIAAISFETLTSPALKPYYKRTVARYQNQQGPVVSRL
jgi:dCTP deaminase